MPEQVSQKTEPADNGRGPGEASAATQLGVMLQLLWRSPQRKILLALSLGLIIVVGVTAYMQIRLNAWNQPFYDALARRDLPAFIEQLGVFAVLAGILLVLNVGQIWLNLIAKLKLREGLVCDLIDEWLLPKRAFRLTSAGEIGINPDQRIHEDSRKLTEYSVDLGVGLLQATVLLFSFIGVLWVLSEGIVLPIAGRTISIPGYMVWSALFYAGVASLLSWLVGHPLVGHNAALYAREAEFRSLLVRVNERIDGISLEGGEADEKSRLIAVFDTVLDVTRRIAWARTRLTWITAGYGWFTIVAGILVAAPGYFAGALSFGALMMAVGAFNQVQQALRWFVDEVPVIADWRATLLRVISFRNAVLMMDQLGKTASWINFAPSKDDAIRMDDLVIIMPFGSAKLSEPHVVIRRGERVLIAGERGAEKTMLFRAMAGLWPWGYGRIEFPPWESVVFMPRNPYVPFGTLRAAVTYPNATVAYDDRDIAEALTQVGLGHLASKLDVTERWDRTLNEDETHSLAFARLFLKKPDWVVIDEELDALDDVSRQRIAYQLRTKLKGVGMVYIGRDQPEDHAFTRKLHLIVDAQGPSLSAISRRERSPKPPSRESLVDE